MTLIASIINRFQLARATVFYSNYSLTFNENNPEYKNQYINVIHNPWEVDQLLKLNHDISLQSTLIKHLIILANLVSDVS